VSPRRQSLNSFPSKVLGKVSVPARRPQARVSYLILSEIGRDTVLLQMTYAAVPECMHPTGCDLKLFADGRENPKVLVLP
jgi:hypothetical protein